MAAPRESAAGGDVGSHHSSLRQGDYVELSGLVSRTELNGRTAVVTKDFVAGCGQERVEIQLYTLTGGAVLLPGAYMSVKPTNLRSLPSLPVENSGVAGTDTVEAALEETLTGSVGPDVVAAVMQHLPCTRCCRPCEGHCRVPHPPHLQLENGSVFGPDGATFNYFCEACHRGYSLHSNDMMNPDQKEIQSGPEWCFEGEHSLVPLPAGDLRCVGNDVVQLKAGPDLQSQLDQLPETHPNVKVLVVNSIGRYDGSNRVALEVELPLLEEVQLVDIAFGKISLTEALTPKVRKLRLQNVPDDCHLSVMLPELEDVTIHYFSGNAISIQEMLHFATKLRSFDSYKLWSNSDIEFASNDLTDIRLHRSDALSSITLWAPRLQSLNVQACYGLEDIHILDDDELAADLPEGFTPTQFEIFTLNANLEPALRAYLRAHPRVIFGHTGESDSDDDFFLMGGGGGGPFGGGMGPMEALFGQVHGMMGAGGPMPGPFGGMMGDGDLMGGGGDPMDELRMLFAEMATAGMMEDMFGDEYDEDEDDEDEDDDDEWETIDGEYTDATDSDGDSEGDDGIPLPARDAPTASTVTVTEITDDE